VAGDRPPRRVHAAPLAGRRWGCYELPICSINLEIVDEAKQYLPNCQHFLTANFADENSCDTLSSFKLEKI
jgi:hypothetical protein